MTDGALTPGIGWDLMIGVILVLGTLVIMLLLWPWGRRPSLPNGSSPEDHRPGWFRLTARLLGPVVLFLAVSEHLGRFESWTVWRLPLATAVFAWIVWQTWKALRPGWVPYRAVAAFPSVPTASRRFRWLAIALLAPIVLLAFLASLAVVRDWNVARSEAAQRAHDLGRSVLDRLEDVVTSSGSRIGRGPGTAGDTWEAERPSFVVDAENRLVSPEASAWPPEPQPLADELSQQKRAQWEAATAAYTSGRWEEALHDLDTFLEGRVRSGRHREPDRQAGLLTPRARAMALLQRALVLERLGRTNELVAELQLVIDHAAVGREPTLLTEAGLPAIHLAALRILELAEAKPDALPDAWRSDPLGIARLLVRSASTPYLAEVLARLKALAPTLLPGVSPESADRLIQRFIAEYEHAEGLRRLHAAAIRERSEGGAWPDAFWVSGPPEAVLAIRLDSESPSPVERRYGVLSESLVRAAVRSAADLADRRGRFRVHLMMAGRGLDVPESTVDTGPPPPPLSVVNGSENSGLPLVASVFVVNPPAFFAAQRERLQRLAWLLVGSCAVALVAVRAAHSALVRQHELTIRQRNFVSAVSHELRAPLGSIRLLAEGLERGTLTDDARRQEYYRLIGQETGRLAALVENVLDYSRIGQGRKAYEFEPTDLRALTEASVRIIAPRASAAEVRLDLELPPPTVSLEARADGRAIQQALLNLLDNALKHSPPGSGIQVQLVEAGNPGGARGGFHLSVGDQGPGIPAEDQERIFEPFFRRGSELTRETPGVGIGLSIVRHIAEAHGGSITVTSAPGQGATFTLALPGATSPPNPPPDVTRPDH